MAATQEMSIVTELINEVESYLPDMSAFLRALAGDITSPNEESDKELHRMIHTIKGAAAMVQLEDLSKTAALMEDQLDLVLAGKRVWNKELIEVMSNTVGGIGSYCSALHKGDSDGTELYSQTRDAFVGVEDARAAVPVGNDNLTDEEDDLLSLLGGSEEDESDDDFFQQMPGGDDNEDEHLAILLGSEAGEAEDKYLEELLGIEDDASGELVPDETIDDSLNKPAFTIDQELQESFDEEAEEHLDNVSRQLNELSSSVGESIDVTDDIRERLHSIRRSVHTLKGAAAVIGIEPVAAWGHDFEDFLDNLHDESDTISPDSIAAMQDGADILEQIALDPGVDVSAEITTLQSLFPAIMAEASVSAEPSGEESVLQYSEEVELIDPAPEPDAPLNIEEIKPQSVSHDIVSPDIFEQETVIDSGRKHIFQDLNKGPAAHVAPVRVTGSKDKRKQTRKRTLRVGSRKIAEILGLSGDMTINLSSFENSALSMQASLNEFEITLQRLKGIVSSLEAGHQQVSIPHTVSAVEDGQFEYGVTEEFDPLEMDRYSEFHVLMNSLHEAVVDLGSIKEQTFEVQDLWRLAVDRQIRVVGEVQGAVQAIQMTSFSTLANRLYKTVRESARATGKNVRLLIEGGSIEMDTHIWNVLADALMHMLRNCVDHGVESTEERALFGKSEQATIRINCSRRGNRFILRLSDDGGGLNYDAIRERASALYSKKDVAGMDNKELAALIFKQGFSVRAKVTSMSGRGVGMDVVRDALDQLNGFIEVYSNSGQGTDFVLSIPIAVAQFPALMVMFGNQQFAVPMRDINSVFRVSGQEMIRDTFEINDESFPLLRPAELMLLKPFVDSTDHRSGLQDSSLALAVETAGRRGVIVADAIIGQQNVVFKSLGSHLENISCVAGATILGDGSMVPILQTEDLFSRAETAVVQDDVVSQDNHDEKKPLEILIADDSISIRKVLSNFITGQGWQATAAHDGVDALEKLRERRPDLILLDIEMPRMNGFEVLQTLQSQSAYRDIPVLMLTSRSADKYREKAAGLGARGFVTKPFKDEELVALINGITSQKMMAS